MHVDAVLRAAASKPGLVVVLTGAGISAESGIPTFRGPEGYWTIGSRHYRSEELATRATFERHPEIVWGWYLHRRGVCRAARPNAAHLAVVDLERGLGRRFALLTQNVDGLHLEAGSSPARTYEVHGNLHRMRCAAECSGSLRAVPESLVARPQADAVTPAEREMLRCARCGGWMRPHVLWFDESYDEEHFRFDSALQAAGRAALLLVVGSSGATTLPVRAAQLAAAGGAALIDVNPEANPFATLASQSAVGCALRGSAGGTLPRLVARCLQLFDTSLPQS